MYLWKIMRKYFVIKSFGGTCSSVKILKWYILIFWNAVGVHAHMSECWRVHDKKNVGNHWSNTSCRFVLREAVSHTNYYCLLKIKNIWPIPKILGLATSQVASNLKLGKCSAWTKASLTWNCSRHVNLNINRDLVALQLRKSRWRHSFN